MWWCRLKRRGSWTDWSLFYCLLVCFGRIWRGFIKRFLPDVVWLNESVCNSTRIIDRLRCVGVCFVNANRFGYSKLILYTVQYQLRQRLDAIFCVSHSSMTDADDSLDGALNTHTHTHKYSCRNRTHSGSARISACHRHNQHVHSSRVAGQPRHGEREHSANGRLCSAVRQSEQHDHVRDCPQIGHGKCV